MLGNSLTKGGGSEGEGLQWLLAASGVSCTMHPPPISPMSTVQEAAQASGARLAESQLCLDPEAELAPPSLDAFLLL